MTTDAPAYSVGSVVAIQGCGFLDYIGQRLPIFVGGGYGNEHIIEAGVVLIDPSGNFAYNFHLSAATSQDYVFGYTVELADPGGLYLVRGHFDIADCGDADGNQAANSIDAQVILQVAAGLVTRPPFFPLFADVNRDNMMDSRDALLILQFTAGLIPGLSCTPPSF